MYCCRERTGDFGPLQAIYAGGHTSVTLTRLSSSGLVPMNIIHIIGQPDFDMEYA